MGWKKNERAVQSGTTYLMGIYRRLPALQPAELVLRLPPRYSGLHAKAPNRSLSSILLHEKLAPGLAHLHHTRLKRSVGSRVLVGNFGLHKRLERLAIRRGSSHERPGSGSPFTASEHTINELRSIYKGLRMAIASLEVVLASRSRPKSKAIKRLR